MLHCDSFALMIPSQFAMPCTRSLERRGYSETITAFGATRSMTVARKHGCVAGGLIPYGPCSFLMELMAKERVPYCLWLGPKARSCEERARKRDERCKGQRGPINVGKIDAKVSRSRSKYKSQNLQDTIVPPDEMMDCVRSLVLVDGCC